MLAVGAGVLAVVGYFAPWARSGSVDRSSIDLLVTAGSLDLLEGPLRLLAAGAWGVVPVLVAAALLALTWHRYQLAATLLLPIGPVLTAGALIVNVQSNDAFRLRWGAPIVALCALTASVAAILVLANSRSKG